MARRYDVRVGPNAKYRICKKIGSGSFGEIFLGENVERGDKVAIKLEKTKATKPQLLNEAKLCSFLAESVRLPKVSWFGTEGNYNVMIMDLLGPSLEDLFRFCNNTFSLKTVLMLADQMLELVEDIHKRNYIHRDIKPDNFLIGRGEHASQLHVIDFGLAKEYLDPKTQQHIPYKEGRIMAGTLRYASINVHLTVEQSRRDDLEALGYILLYFLRGKLPWQGLMVAGENEDDTKIIEKKMTTTVGSLCRKFPREFATYLNYCRQLKFDDTPDYDYLRRLFKELFIREGFQYDFVFDWSIADGHSQDADKPMKRTPSSRSLEQFVCPKLSNGSAVRPSPNERSRTKESSSTKASVSAN